jgi:uncharacterized protein YacL
MVLEILRGVFLLLVATVITLYVGQDFQEQASLSFWAVAAIMLGAVGVALAVIAADVAAPRKRLSAISGIFLGLLAGLLAAYALSFVVDLAGVYLRPIEPDKAAAFEGLLQGVKVVIGLITCYLGISLVLQTKDDFRFVLPYVEFAKQVRGQRPLMLDSSVLIDGRIEDLIQTGLLQGRLIVPDFVLEELQAVADSGDKLKRARGRRGLDVLGRLRESAAVEVMDDPPLTQAGGVDHKLIDVAGQMPARVMTGDIGLEKVAAVRGVEVVNLNEVAKAMRPVVLPGEQLSVRLVKPGESAQQGVGYLDDGTMVVVEDGRDHLQQTVTIAATSTLQTSAGRMIFGKIAEGESPVPRPAATAGDPPAADPPAAKSTGASAAPERPHRAGRANPRRNPRRS